MIVVKAIDQNGNFNYTNLTVNVTYNLSSSNVSLVASILKTLAPYKIRPMPAVSAATDLTLVS